MGYHPRSPIFFDLVWNRMGNCLGVVGIGDSLEDIADKDSLENITKT